MRNSGGKTYVSLTFDDGPTKKYTPAILDILKRFNTEATFFLVGKNAENNPDIVIRIFEEGHDVGNHTYSHPVSPIFNYRAVEKDIERAGTIIQKITGQKPRLFRPTWAPWDIHAKKLMAIAENLNYLPVRWSLSSMDWLGVGNLIKRRISNSKIASGEILLFHDGAQKWPIPNRRATVDLLPHILRMLSRKDVLPVKLSEQLFLYEKHPYANSPNYDARDDEGAGIQR